MALVLGVAPGDIIDIADDWISVLRAEKVNRLLLQRSDGSRVAVYDDHLTEVLPSVDVQLGPDSGRLRLCFKAPRGITIVRRR